MWGQCIGGTMKTERDGVDPLAKPSGTGCVECLATNGWWFHLRRCAQCGHIGCCDSSPSQHASKHHAATGHPITTSFEPGERWFYDYRSGEFFAGPACSAFTSLRSARAWTYWPGAVRLARTAPRVNGRSANADIRADAHGSSAAGEPSLGRMRCAFRYSTHTVPVAPHRARW